MLLHVGPQSSDRPASQHVKECLRHSLRTPVAPPAPLGKAQCLLAVVTSGSVQETCHALKVTPNPPDCVSDLSSLMRTSAAESRPNLPAINRGVSSSDALYVLSRSSQGALPPARRARPVPLLTSLCMCAFAARAAAIPLCSHKELTYLGSQRADATNLWMHRVPCEIPNQIHASHDQNIDQQAPLPACEGCIRNKPGDSDSSRIARESRLRITLVSTLFSYP